MQQMRVRTQVVSSAENRIGKTVKSIARSRAKQRIGHRPICVVHDGHRLVYGGGQDVGGHRKRSVTVCNHVRPVDILSKLSRQRGGDRRRGDGSPATESIRDEGVCAGMQ